jgi:hypothetical protein
VRRFSWIELVSERVKNKNFLNSRKFPATCCGKLQEFFFDWSIFLG